MILGNNYVDTKCLCSKTFLQDIRSCELIGFYTIPADHIIELHRVFPVLYCCAGYFETINYDYQAVKNVYFEFDYET